MKEDHNLASLLKVKKTSKDCYQSLYHTENFLETLFGGQVLGQALMSASHTVENRLPHSLHAYFLSAGTSKYPVDYQVSRTRDGKSFSNREVKATQQDKMLFSMSTSFQKIETGYEHQAQFPSLLPSPEELLENYQPTNDIPEHGRKREAANPFQLLPASKNLFTSQNLHEPDAYFWIKPSINLPDDTNTHSAALAFASDLGLLATAVLPHPTNMFEGKLIVASIDHAMWFHSHDIDFSDWLLCHTHSPWAGNARGFSTARIYDRHRRLLASTAQEGLIRPIGIA